MAPYTPDPETRKEIDAVVYAEHRRRDRRNARFWLAALLVGIVASIGVALVDDYPLIKALLVLIGFIGIFGFLAFLSVTRSLRGLFDNLMGLP
ncbi:MAG: hypothetical protein OER43_13725 [Gammaproteobacteria bacterium]|nr:hypothetical protein [Gammaproteobacteria bacterium]MDH3413357.1 hypothetical protein [Gammaproteobacteria bacterium]